MPMAVAVIVGQALPLSATGMAVFLTKHQK
jgi:hypothetical protein